MEVLLPHSLDEALEIKAQHPEAVPLSGGTDLMVELNFGRVRPPAIVDLTRVAELTTWRGANGRCPGTSFSPARRRPRPLRTSSSSAPAGNACAAPAVFPRSARATRW